MSVLERIVPDGEQSSREAEWAPGGVFSELGPYRWVAWFVIIEVGLLLSGIVLGELNADLIGGLFAAVAVILAVGAVAGVAVMGLYRIVWIVR